MPSIDEHRSGLAKYYKSVFRCRMCSEEYGVDYDAKEEAKHLTCPRCLEAMKGKRSIFARLPRSNETKVLNT